TSTKSHLLRFGSLSKSAKPVNKRQILDDITGFARPGEMVGIMGPSGSGKTTLLNTLSGRLKPDCGCIALNGETLNKQLRRRICYVLQHDIFFPDLTLKQTLIYTALLRLPDSMSYQHKIKKVEHIIDLLDLRQCQNTIIGDILKRGLSGGEKKRANIACELLTNPSVMLIDEPTSGLDSTTAFNIIHTLKEYAVKERKTMVATVHQPSSQIFFLFDRLLLLSNGKLAYFGSVEDVVPFFSRIGYQIEPHFNPADFMMEKIKMSAEDELKIVTAAKGLNKSPPHSPKLEKETSINSNHSNHIKNDSSYVIEANEDNDCNAKLSSESQEVETKPLWSDCANEEHTDVSNNIGVGKTVELKVVVDESCKKINKVYTKIVNDDDSGRSSWTETDRSSTSTFSSSSSTASTDDMYYGSSLYSSSHKINKDERWPTSFSSQFKVLTKRNFYEARGRLLSKMNWIQTICLGLVTGLMWFQVQRTESTLNDIRGWMFFSSSYWMLFAWFGGLTSIPTEIEVINKERISGAYRLSSYYLAKTVGELPLTITPPSVFYIISYPMFGCYNWTTFLLQWAFLILNSVVAQSIGLFIGMSSMHLETSVMFSALYSTATNLFAGFYSSAIPPWLSWLRYFSIVYYAFHNMQLIEFFSGPPITCSPINSRFTYCLNQRNGSKPLEEIAIPYEELIRQIDNFNQDSEPLPIWLNTLALLFFLLIFRVSGYLVLKYIRKPK
ncbi:ABC transporter G family member 21-like protein, partial [Leptotrombidium deliense]